MEIWKTITDYPNYQVSNYGNVKNIRFNRILKCTITPYGYKVCSLGKNKFYKSYFVHRLIASAFVDNPNNYPCVNHKDENKLNNNRFGYSNDKIKLKDNIIVKIKNNIVVETIK